MNTTEKAHAYTMALTMEALQTKPDRIREAQTLITQAIETLEKYRKETGTKTGGPQWEHLRKCALQLSNTRAGIADTPRKATR